MVRTPPIFAWSALTESTFPPNSADAGAVKAKVPKTNGRTNLLQIEAEKSLNCIRLSEHRPRAYCGKENVKMRTA